MELASRNSTGNSLSFYKSQMDEEYLKASKSGDLNKVLECLAAGVKPDVTNPGGLNILHFAARENHLDICKVALNHGIDIKALTKRLNTALHIASLGGHAKIVKLLIDHGAKVNLQAKDDITPLYMAAQENHIDTVDTLLKYGANPHIAAKGGFEPLDIAVQQGHVDVVTMLLEKDAKHGMKAMHQAAKKNDKSALKLLINDGKHSVNARAPNGYTPLHIASKFGSVNAANYLIDHGADLNAAAKHNIVPLHVASRHAQVQSISVLVKAGADLSICTKDGLSALHCAARDGHDHCVELLLVHGAPITAKTRHGLTALHMASQGDHVASANHLLAHGAHIDDVTTDGVTSLHVTSHYGQVKTAQLLLEKGANIDHRALNGYTALHIASKKNREAIVQLLLKHKASVHIKNNNGQTALHVAAFFGHVSIVLLLLQAGASTEALTVREETVLHIACRTIRIQIVRLLIRNNAKINAQTKDGETPLHVTCRQGDSALVSVLLDNYADPNVQNKEGSTALHLGARDGNEDIVDSLLDHKADVTLLSKRGFTPLHEASKNGHEAIVETLLGRRETNVNASGKNGLTPLHIACHYDQSEVAIQLLNAGADIQAQAKNGFTPLHISAKKSQINICNLLFERGVEADMTTRHGVSPLHLAVKEGDIEIVDTLLEHGASPSLQTTNGLSPLHVSVHYNKVDVVKRLLKYTTGIVNLPTQTGFTPLHLAASYGHYEMAKLLLENEANVEAKTKTGNTPLHLATVKGHKDVINLLLKYNASPNALNKEGHTALYLAEITQQVTIITVLQKITTKIVIKKEESKIPAAKRWERVRHIFLNPEALEETLLIEATDEAEDKVHKEKKSIQKDFEEDFAGLEDHPSPLLQQKQNGSNQVVEDSVEIKNQIVEETEIAMVDQSQVENSAQNDDDYLNSLDAAPGVVIANGHDEVPEKKKEVRVLTKKMLVERDYQKIISENSFLSGPPKQGTFLISFNVDARGATMVSKQSGIRITLPPGACQMPTRVTVRFRKSDTLPANLTLLPQERIASRVLQISPEGMDLLRPVTLEIPHFVALKLKERELVVMKNDPKHSKWKEVPIDENATKTPGYVAVTLPEVPDKLVLVSRPLKERYAMNPSGGEIRSASIPDVAITFPQKTLNTTTKLILQSQRIDRNLITSNSDQAPGLGPIISLDPPTKLSKPINVTTPLPKGNKDGKLHLLAWVPKDAKASSSSSIRLDCEWKDITESTPLKVVGHSATFSTNDFTRYWLIQTKDIESTLKNIGQYEEEASIIQYNAQFIVYARMLSEKSGELRICLITDDYAAKEDMFNANEGFTELARSDRIATYKGQTLNIRLAEEISTNQSPRNMRITFQPFQINSIQFRVDFARSPSEGVVNGLVSFISERIRKDEAHFCFFEIKFGPELCKKVHKIQLPEDTVNDDVINMVGQGVGEDWFPLADELNMSNRDKQAVVDISSGKYDIAASRMLEYWRAKKPIDATYKQLYDALKRLGYVELAENVYNASPNEISREVQSRPVSSNRHYATSPSFDTLSVVKKTGVEHARQSPPMESDSQFSVSPVPSDDRLSPLIADSPPPVLEERPGFRRSKTDLESRNFSPDVASEKYLDEESGKRIEFEENPVSSSEYNRERWSTTATYATNTPEEDKVPITPSDDGRYIDSPVSPVSIRSERSKEYQEGEMEPLHFRTESFENSIATPCDVSAAVTPHSISPECTDDVHTETEVVESVYSEDPPVVDFSALGDVPAGESFQNEEIPTEEPRALSPYELSMQQVQQEEQEAWERHHEERPRDHESKTPVDENDVLEVKEEKVWCRV
uniref:Uncharacterized protein n=1 Tax=Clytia hemisphaerica TaxID=252671 RepID=A0A7M5X2I4_9CNID